MGRVEILITVVQVNETDEDDPVRMVQGLRSNLYSELLAIPLVRVIDVSRYG